MHRPFRFGLQSYAPDSAAAWRAQAQRAEGLGFAVFSVADHVIGPGPALAATGHPVQTVAAIPAMAVAAGRPAVFIAS
jgi:alkanesulfonate monooxygenase SsuD/methylene tetrahydromethanopterin reductase-like flavin-dependent oxidoreductase (luciferase family)